MPKLRTHSETEPKSAAIRPSRKRVAQRDCFQGATDFSERVAAASARSKAKCSIELALPAAARAKERNKKPHPAASKKSERPRAA